MKHFLITAGGTIENIDDIRKITNTSTGQLGALICEELIRGLQLEVSGTDYCIHYVVSKTAVLPVLEESTLTKVRFYFVDNTKSVMECIQRILNEFPIDCGIHSMAISDFTVHHAIPLKDLAKEIASKISESPKGELEDLIEGILLNPDSRIQIESKIPSDQELILTLEKTPKIIGLFKEHQKKCLLVGFKLLKNVSEAELIQVANRMAQVVGCDLVLANDYKSIEAGLHEGILLEEGNIIGRYSGKKEIARGIVCNVLRRIE